MGLVSELRRRNVLRMVVLYVVAAWLIMQVAEVLIGLAKLPDWIGATTLGLLAIGFPIALIFSWFYELTPEGISLEKDIEPGASITHATGRRIDFVVISLLCAALLMFAWHTWWPSSPLDNSIAVLPFENTSGDSQQEYLSDGLSEELLYLLSQSPELRVISRTSAFSYKGKDVRLADVARELNVAHVLEGSVSKIGDRLRVTAQLIEARSDTRVWSDTYESEIGELLDVRDGIAGSVVAQLGVPDDSSRVSAQEIKVDSAAYDDYLRGLYWADQVSEQSLLKAEDAFVRSLEIDPTFADSWAELGYIYRFRADRGQIDREQGIRQSRAAALRAIELNPNNAKAYALIGRIRENYDFDWQGAQEAYDKARQLAPNDISALRGSAHFSFTFGRLDEAIELYQEAFIRDPLSIRSLQHLAVARFYVGDYYDCESLADQILARDSDHPTANYLLALAYVMQDKSEEAIKQSQNESVEPLKLVGGVIANWSIGDYQQAHALQSQLIESFGDFWFYQIAETYAFMGMNDQAFNWLDKAIDHRDSGLVGTLSDPLLENLRADARWGDLLKKLGLEK